VSLNKSTKQLRSRIAQKAKKCWLAQRPQDARFDPEFKVQVSSATRAFLENGTKKEESYFVAQIVYRFSGFGSYQSLGLSLKDRPGDASGASQKEALENLLSQY